MAAVTSREKTISFPFINYIMQIVLCITFWVNLKTKRSNKTEQLH